MDPFSNGIPSVLLSRQHCQFHRRIYIYLLCSISLFAVGLQGQKRANGALCSRIFAPLNAEFEPRFCSRVQKHQLRASNGERTKNRVTFDPFFSVRRSPFAVQGYKLPALHSLKTSVIYSGNPPVFLLRMLFCR